MIRRLPVWPTLLVLMAVVTMVALGIWQWQRKAEKEAAIAAVGANLRLPAMSFPKTGPVEDAILFRRSSLVCLRVTGWQTQAGRAADGSAGFAYIARCATGAEGQGALVLLGIGGKPDLQPDWKGGAIDGWISREPDTRSLFARIGSDAPALRPMLIARSGTAGLRAPASPKAEDIPNNHLAYAVQWWLFALVALVIYGLALARRGGRRDS